MHVCLNWTFDVYIVLSGHRILLVNKWYWSSRSKSKIAVSKQLKIEIELFVIWNEIKLEIISLPETEIELKLVLFCLNWNKHQQYSITKVKYHRIWPSCATPIEQIQCEIPQVVAGCITEINNAIVVNIEIIQQIQRTTTNVDVRRQQQMWITCVRWQIHTNWLVRV